MLQRCFPSFPWAPLIRRTSSDPGRTMKNSFGVSPPDSSEPTRARSAALAHRFPRAGTAAERRTVPRASHTNRRQRRTSGGRGAAYLRISSRLMMSRYRCGATRLR
jgi:hypothetical protein